LAKIEGSRHHTQKSKFAALKLSDFKRLLTPYSLILMWLLFSNAFATSSKFLSVQLYGKVELHFTNKQLGYYATAGNVGSLLGSFVYGWFSHGHAKGKFTWISRHQLDKFNLILACFGQGGMMLILVLRKVDWLAYICGFALQFFWSGWMIFSRALVLNYCPPGIAGSFAAVMFAAPNAGQVTGPMAIGATSKKVGPTIAVIITAILFCIPGVSSFFYRHPPIPDLVVGENVINRETSNPAPYQQLEDIEFRDMVPEEEKSVEP